MVHRTKSKRYQRLYCEKEVFISPLHALVPQCSPKKTQDFPGGAVVKNLPAKAGDTGSSPGPERSHRPRSN